MDVLRNEAVNCRFPRNNIKPILENINSLYKFGVIGKEEKKKLTNLTQTGLKTGNFTPLYERFVFLHKTEVVLNDVILQCVNLCVEQEDDYAD